LLQVIHLVGPLPPGLLERLVTTMAPVTTRTVRRAVADLVAACVLAKEPLSSRGGIDAGNRMVAVPGKYFEHFIRMIDGLPPDAAVKPARWARSDRPVLYHLLARIIGGASVCAGADFLTGALYVAKAVATAHRDHLLSTMDEHRMLRSVPSSVRLLGLVQSGTNLVELIASGQKLRSRGIEDANLRRHLKTLEVVWVVVGGRFTGVREQPPKPRKSRDDRKDPGFTALPERYVSGTRDGLQLLLSAALQTPLAVRRPPGDVLRSLRVLASYAAAHDRERSAPVRAAADLARAAHTPRPNEVAMGVPMRVKAVATRR
jgi:hypothetical protein